MARGPIKKKIKKKKGQLRLKGLSGIAVNPTEQEIKIAEGLAKGLSKKDALVDAGISESNARSNSAELTSTPGVNKAFRDALARAQVGVDRIAGVVDAGLKATKVIGVDKDDELILFPDFSERRQMARLAGEFMDGFPDKKFDLPEDTGSLSVTIKRAAK